MAVVWSDWKHFPDPHSGVPFDAPAGRGVFEVRHIATGEQVAFAVSANVAASLAKSDSGAIRRACFRSSPATASRTGRSDLEYRTCATASMSEARSEADRLNGLRRAYFQRRKASGWA